jgi:hypothetical protein
MDTAAFVFIFIFSGVEFDSAMIPALFHQEKSYIIYEGFVIYEDLVGRPCADVVFIWLGQSG